MSPSPNVRRSLATGAFDAVARLLPPNIPPGDAAELRGMFEDALDEAGPSLQSGVVAARELASLARLVVRERFTHHRALRLVHRRRIADARAQLPYSDDTSMLESSLQDVRYALRALRRGPSFTIIAIATLALGIGANTAIFSVVNGVLLRPLPFRDPSRIVTVMTSSPTQPPEIYASSPANFNQLRRDTRAARSMASFSTRMVTLTGQGEPESLQAVTTTGDLFGVLGVKPLFGRTLTPGDDSPSAASAIVLSYDAWHRVFGEDRAILGTSVTINGQPRVVVGVMPKEFTFAAARADLWISEQWSPEYSVNRDQYYLQIVARLAGGQTTQRFSAELETVAARLRTDFAEFNTDLHLGAMPLQETVVSGVRTRLLVLMGAVGFLLLITCANLANLTLARASARQGEFAVRRALGAGRWRVARQLITESVLLSAAGGIVGLLVGLGLLRAIVAAEKTSLPRVDEIGLDVTTLAFAILVSLVAGIAVGVVPALRASTARSMEALRQGLRGSGSHQRARSVLVVAELAIALMLLTGAGLLLRSFGRLLDVNTGFSTERLLTMQMTVGTRSQQKVEETLERLRAIPGVRAASVASQLPVTGRGSGAWFNIIDRPTPPNETPPGEAYRVVSPEYFTTMGIRLVRGRFPTQDDDINRAPGLVVNEALARKYWPNADPIGKLVRLGAPGNYLIPETPIVGVVGDTPDAGLDSPPLPIVFMPMRIVPWWPVFTYVVRTAGPAESVTSRVRRELRASFPTIAIRNVRTMEAVLHDSVAPARLSMRLIGAFALVALITAALGVFGVLSFVVAQRTRELGIRIALGAAPTDVRRLVVGYGARLAVVGLAIGLVGSFALTRLIATMLFGVTPTDPVTFGTVSALLLGIGLVASWLPARRATRIDPISALRAD
jgi:predicted permease